MCLSRNKNRRTGHVRCVLTFRFCCARGLVQWGQKQEEKREVEGSGEKSFKFQFKQRPSFGRRLTGTTLVVDQAKCSDFMQLGEQRVILEHTAQEEQEEEEKEERAKLI